MKELVMGFCFVALLASCSKDTTEKRVSEEDYRQQRITAALHTSNPIRNEIAERILLGGQTNNKEFYLESIIAKDKKTGFRTFGYAVIRKDQKIARSIDPVSLGSGFGIYTGWILKNSGCWVHGTFIWSGSIDNFVFTEDPNPYGDNYIGNEPRCMSQKEFDTWC